MHRYDIKTCSKYLYSSFGAHTCTVLVRCDWYSYSQIWKFKNSCKFVISYLHSLKPFVLVHWCVPVAYWYLQPEPILMYRCLYSHWVWWIFLCTMIIKQLTISSKYLWKAVFALGSRIAWFLHFLNNPANFKIVCSISHSFWGNPLGENVDFFSLKLIEISPKNQKPPLPPIKIFWKGGNFPLKFWDLEPTLMKGFLICNVSVLSLLWKFLSKMWYLLRRCTWNRWGKKLWTGL